MHFEITADIFLKGILVAKYRIIISIIKHENSFPSSFSVKAQLM